jgi:hypothetical protein
MGFLESLWDHKAFSCGLIALFFLLVTNQYQKALAPQMCVEHLYCHVFVLIFHWVGW